MLTVVSTTVFLFSVIIPSLQGSTIIDDDSLVTYEPLEDGAVELGQTPEALSVAAKYDQSPIIRIPLSRTSQTAFVQEGIVAYIDCEPWASQFEGTVQWFIQDIDVEGAIGDYFIIM